MKKPRTYSHAQLEDIKRTIKVVDDTGEIVQVSETGLPSFIRPNDDDVLEELKELEGFQEAQRHKEDEGNFS